jgi:hypothetical protein
MNALQVISILLEVLVVALGIMLVVGKKKMYGLCIALTFVLYVFYDLANLLSLHITQDSRGILFIIATISILWAVWNIFLEALGPRSIAPAEKIAGKIRIGPGQTDTQADGAESAF